MIKPLGNRGAALAVILGTILVVVVLANILLNFMLSQNRLTHHQISRIQAYYAGMGAMNYALERLRKGTWVVGTDCLSTSGGCPVQAIYSATDFHPSVINDVTVIITPDGQALPSGAICNPPNDTEACVDITTDYTYTP